MANKQDMIKEIRKYSLNPGSVLQAQMDGVEGILDGLTVVDASSPFMLNWEMSAVAAAAHITEARALFRKMYKPLAQTAAELSHHLSDRQLVGLWSSPSESEIRLLIPHDDLIDLAVDINLTDSDYSKRLYIPEHAYITVGASRYGWYHGIWIDVMNNGNVSCHWDLSSPNILSERDSNHIESRLVIVEGIRWLEVTLPVSQFTVNSDYYSIDGNVSFQKTIPHADLYYATRAYIDQGNNVWSAINVINSVEVYDLNTPTLLVEVLDGLLVVSLPDIYQSMGLSGKNIRIDVYTTEGAKDDDYREIEVKNIALNLDNKDTYSNTIYTDPFNKIPQKTVYFTKPVTGGRDALTFEQIRQRSMFNISDVGTPVNFSQLLSLMNERGYSTQRYIDNITDRLYVSSKMLPPTTIDGLNRRVNALLDWVSVLESGTNYGLSVRFNGNRITVTSDAWFLRKNGITKLLDFSETAALALLRSSNVGQFVTKMNADNYLYTPFHYVIDGTTEKLKVKPYLLTAPSARSRSFISRNGSLNIMIETRSIDVETVRNLDGYFTGYEVKLTAVIPSNFLKNNINAVYAQIRYLTPDGVPAFLTGDIESQTASTITWNFPVTTEFDIDGSDKLAVSNMVDQTGNYVPMSIPLKGEYEIFYIVRKTSVTMDQSSFEGEYSHVAGETINSVVGATRELIEITLGRSLDNLYCPSRSLIGPVNYLKYLTDVQAVYTEDVLRPDPLTVWAVDATGGIIIDHEAGDLMWQDAAETIPVLAYRAGDLMRGIDGKHIPDPNGRIVERSFGAVLIDAKYRVVTSPTAVEQNSKVVEDILYCLDTDIQYINSRIIEKSRLEFKPKGVLGDVLVHIGDNVEIIIDNRLEFDIEIQLTRKGMLNYGTQTAMVTSIRKIISKILEQDTISISTITSEIQKIVTEDVIGFNVKGFGSDRDLKYIALTDSSTNFVSKDNLVILNDGSWDVMDSVKINFVRFTD